MFENKQQLTDAINLYCFCKCGFIQIYKESNVWNVSQLYVCILLFYMCYFILVFFCFFCVCIFIYMFFR